MKIKNGRLPLTLIYQMQTYKTTTSAYYRLPASNSAWYRLIGFVHVLRLADCCFRHDGATHVIQSTYDYRKTRVIVVTIRDYC
jgi:hypothetical protein